MSHRTQLTLSDEQYATLQRISRESGLSLAELVRRAVDRTYTTASQEALAKSFGGWRGRHGDGRSYVERLRTGLAARLGETAGGAR
jgi:hypothetical protein